MQGRMVQTEPRVDDPVEEEREEQKEDGDEEEQESGGSPLPLLAQLLPASISPFRPIRITSQAKMKNLISTCLSHLLNESSPLVLHTLSPSTSSSTLPTAPPAAKKKKPSSSKSPHTPTSSSALPKLVSVAEIVKRSFTPPQQESSALEAGKKRKGKGKETNGIYQYTRLGAVEELAVNDGLNEVEEALRQQEVAKAWLDGGAGERKRPRKVHTPYMIVVLSTVALDKDSITGFTYQPPETKLTLKASGDVKEHPAKKRRKRRQKNKTDKDGKAVLMEVDSSDDDN